MGSSGEKHDISSGERLQRFAWSLEDGRYGEAASLLRQIQDDSRDWVKAQASELALEQLRKQTRGDAPLPSVLRYYHGLRSGFDPEHRFHTAFLQVINDTIEGLQPGLTGLKAATAISRALGLFQVELGTHPSYVQAIERLSSIRQRSLRIVRATMEQELQGLVAAGKTARAIEVCRELVSQDISPLAAGVLELLEQGRPTTEVLAYTLRQESSLVADGTTQETEFPPLESSPGHPSSSRSRLETSEGRPGSTGATPPRKPWSLTFEAPPVTHDPDGPPHGAGIMPYPDAGGSSRAPAAAHRQAESRLDRAWTALDPLPHDSHPDTPSGHRGLNVDAYPSDPRRQHLPAGVPSPFDDRRSRLPGGKTPQRSGRLGPPPEGEYGPQDPEPLEASGALRGRDQHRLSRAALFAALVLGIAGIVWLMVRPEPRPGPTSELESRVPAARADVAPESNAQTTAKPLPVPEPPRDPDVPDPAERPIGPPGALTVKAHPPDKLEMYLDGKLWPKSALKGVRLPPGRHVLVIYREGYERFRKELWLDPNQTLREQVELQRSPLLNLNVEPPGGVEVRIDNRPIRQNLPLSDYVVSPGPHRLEVTKPGHTTYVREFSAEPGDVLDYSATLVRAYP